jgi:hypothetical protein
MIHDAHALGIFHRDDAHAAQMGDVAADGFDGQAKESGDFGTAQRQVYESARRWLSSVSVKSSLLAR